MEDILKKLSDYAKERVEISKKKISFADMRRQAESISSGNFSFENSLKKNGISFICEVKKASPSRGVIAENFPYVEIAKEYEAAGADAISVLTEPKWFLGSEKYLEEISKNVSIPLLRKDFTVDPYMIYEAKTIGASAVLLICAILEKSQLAEYMEIATEIGLSVLTEAHDEAEIEMALNAGAKIIGVNNRNLKDFSVNTNNAGKLRSLVPSDRIFVSESGIMQPSDILSAKAAGADAVLIGEAFMRASDKKAFLDALKNA